MIPARSRSARNDPEVLSPHEVPYWIRGIFPRKVFFEKQKYLMRRMGMQNIPEPYVHLLLNTNYLYKIIYGFWGKQPMVACQH